MQQAIAAYLPVFMAERKINSKLGHHIENMKRECQVSALVPPLAVIDLVRFFLVNRCISISLGIFTTVVLKNRFWRAERSDSHLIYWYCFEVYLELGKVSLVNYSANFSSVLVICNWHLLLTCDFDY